MFTSSNTRALALALCLALVAPVAACGDDDSGSTSTTPTSNTSTSNTATSNTATSNTATSNTATSNTATSNTATSNTSTNNTSTSNTSTSNTTALVDIPATAAANGNFNLLLAALAAADLTSALEAEGPFTVFAPTDDVINAWLTAAGLTTDELVADTEALTELLSYHVVPGKIFAADLMDGQTAETLQGENLTFTVNADGVSINAYVNVVTPDVEASNGVIHVIDQLLVPPSRLPVDIIETATEAGFETLLDAIDGAGLTETLQGEGPFTVFAPTDEAFAALGDALGAVVAQPNLLEDVLLTHVLAGETYAESVTDGLTVTTLSGVDITFSVTADGVFINDTIEITMTDIEASNGVIHVIDAVIVPADETRNAVEYAIDASVQEGDDAEFTVLVAAVVAAELAEALSGEGPFTIFAPTDAAFVAAIEALQTTAEDLLASDDLAGILQYHVVSGKVMSTDLTDGQTAETLQGQSVTIGVSTDGVTVDGANVIIPDVEVSNGVIHVIDAVILPAE